MFFPAPLLRFLQLRNGSPTIHASARDKQTYLKLLLLLTYASSSQARIVFCLLWIWHISPEWLTRILSAAVASWVASRLAPGER